MELNLKKILPIGLIVLLVMFVMKMMKGRRCEGFTQQTAPKVTCNCNVEKFSEDPATAADAKCKAAFPHNDDFAKYMNCNSCAPLCNYNDEECVENCMACQEECDKGEKDINNCKNGCDMKTRCTDRLPKIKEMSGNVQKKAINDWLVEHDMSKGLCKTREECEKPNSKLTTEQMIQSADIYCGPTLEKLDR